MKEHTKPFPHEGQLVKFIKYLPIIHILPQKCTMFCCKSFNATLKKKIIYITWKQTNANISDKYNIPFY